MLIISICMLKHFHDLRSVEQRSGLEMVKFGFWFFILIHWLVMRKLRRTPRMKRKFFIPRESLVTQFTPPHRMGGFASCTRRWAGGYLPETKAEEYTGPTDPGHPGGKCALKLPSWWHNNWCLEIVGNDLKFINRFGTWLGNSPEYRYLPMRWWAQRQSREA